MLTRDKLHGYQNRAVEFIKTTPKCALWLGLGLGKTVSTLTAISDLVAEFEVHKTLIIAPLKVANNTWHNEINNWEHIDLTYIICTGSVNSRLKAIKTDVDLYIINRENVPWLVKYYGAKWPFDTVVIDEATSFKSYKSMRFKALRLMFRMISRTIELTATPSPNGMLDLWSQICLLDDGARLGKFITHYREKYFSNDYVKYRWDIKSGSYERIMSAISDLTLTMRAEDYIKLPDIIYTNSTVTLPKSLMKSYRSFKKEFIVKMKGGETSSATAGILANKLLQFCNGAIYDTDAGTYSVIHDLKLEALADIVECNPAENLLVAYNYRSDLERICAKFPDAVAMDKEGLCVDKWNRGEIKMLVAHPASAGHGLNLQSGGAIIVWFGLNWSLEYYQQFNGRLYRQGQTKPVTVTHIICEGCIDEKVMTALSDKSTTQDKVLDFLKKDLTK